MFDQYTLIEQSPYVYRSIYSNRTVNMDNRLFGQAFLNSSFESVISSLFLSTSLTLENILSRVLSQDDKTGFAV